MRTPLLSVAALFLAAPASAEVIWDTLAGSAGRSLSASSENILALDWVSSATPIALDASRSITSITVVGQHLRFDGIGVYTPSDPTPSAFYVNAWSSPEAFLASPLNGDLWRVGQAPVVTPLGTSSGADIPLLSFHFDFSSPVQLPSGTSVLGVYSESLPVTFGSFYISRTSDSGPLGLRVNSDDPSTLETLSHPLALKVEAAPVPEPASLFVLLVGACGLVKKRSGRSTLRH